MFWRERGGPEGLGTGWGLPPSEPAVAGDWRGRGRPPGGGREPSGPPASEPPPASPRPAMPWPPSPEPAGPPSILTPPAAPSVPGQPPLSPAGPGEAPRPGAFPGWPGPPARAPTGPGTGAPGRADGPAREDRTAAEAVEKFGSTDVPKTKGNIHCLTIVGQIEGHVVLPSQNKTTKYEHIMPQLVAVEMNPDIEGLLVILNTVGGDVEAGLALAEMLATMAKPCVSLILGGGHSIGIPIAVAADYSFIAPTATMTIHPIRLSGLVIGVPQTYEYLDKMQDRVVRFIVENSRISEGRLRGLMFRTGELARDIGTVLVGQEAVSEGLIDEVGGVAQALSKLNSLIASARGPRGARPA